MRPKAETRQKTGSLSNGGIPVFLVPCFQRSRAYALDGEALRVSAPTRVEHRRGRSGQDGAASGHGAPLPAACARQLAGAADH